MGERYKRVDSRARLMFAEALRHVLDVVQGKTFIKCDKALLACLLLILLIYMRHFHATWKQGKDVQIKAKLLDLRRGFDSIHPLHYT